MTTKVSVLKPFVKPDPVTPTPLLLTVADVADLLNCSKRHVWSLHAGHELPAAISLGRSTRWSRAVIEEWIRSGCPKRR